MNLERELQEQNRNDNKPRLSILTDRSGNIRTPNVLLLYATRDGCP